MEIPLLRVAQWLDAWDGYAYDPEQRQAKPQPEFYLASLPAGLLRRLAGVRPRQGGGGAADPNIQRVHNRLRSDRIRDYVEAGYPWAALNARKKAEYPRLKKPGWLPTAIVVNVLAEDAARGEATVAPNDLVHIRPMDGHPDMAVLVVPDGAEIPGWVRTGQLDPLEIIDGQHRVHAFGPEHETNFQLPVVLFNNIDVSWEAYLFWTININPVRISPSLAFDLYPLLRTEDWLDPSIVDGPLAYREARAQELTENLNTTPGSPWYGRVSMLGRSRGKVTQAAFVRSLTLSYIRPATNRVGLPAGLFASLLPGRDAVLPWTRPQQAAFLILAWDALERAIGASTEEWCESIRRLDDAVVLADKDPAFASQYSLLLTDQGVRGFLLVTNDLCYEVSTDVNFGEWQSDEGSDEEDLSLAIVALVQDLRANQPDITALLEEIANALASFDWRSKTVRGLSEEESNRQARFGGGTGYADLRRYLLEHIARVGSRRLQQTSASLVERMWPRPDA